MLSLNNDDEVVWIVRQRWLFLQVNSIFFSKPNFFTYFEIFANLTFSHSVINPVIEAVEAVKVPLESPAVDRRIKPKMEDEESNSSASFKFVPYVETTKPFEMSDFYKYSTKFKKSKNGSESSSTSSNDNNNKPPGTITKIFFFLFQIVCNIKRNVLQNCQRKIHLPNQHQHHLLHQRI